MKAVLNDLYDHKLLNKQEAKKLLINVAEGNFNSAQLSALLSVFLMRAISVDELSGFRDAMLELCLPVRFEEETLDIVGSGGDNKNTFNISTAACFVVAGTGIKVAKHGNYGVSSVSGSSNLLEHLGYQFSNDTFKLKKEIEKAGICFMHAPLFHPAMKNLGPVRKELGIRTFFNMLGPLVNPCIPDYQLIGTYNLELARLYHYLLQMEGKKYSIVHSYDGYDEVSLTGRFKIFTRDDESVLSPEDLNLDQVMEQDLNCGSSIEAAAEIFKSVLSDSGTKSQKEVVIANAALAIRCCDPEVSFYECVERAKESLHSRKAEKVFKTLISIQK